MNQARHTCESHIRRYVTHMNESCHTCENVMSHIRTSHFTLKKRTCHFSHFTRCVACLSHFTFHSSQSTFHISRCTFHISHFTFHISHFTFHTHFSFHTMRDMSFTFHISHFTFHMSHFKLISHFTLCVPCLPHFTLWGGYNW